MLSRNVLTHPEGAAIAVSRVDGSVTTGDGALPGASGAEPVGAVVTFIAPRLITGALFGWMTPTMVWPTTVMLSMSTSPRASPLNSSAM